MLRFLCTVVIVLTTNCMALAENVGGNRTGTQLVNFLRANFRPAVRAAVAIPDWRATPADQCVPTGGHRRPDVIIGSILKRD